MQVLIVMSSHEIFDPKGSLWSKTWAIIDKCHRPLLAP
jgi:hypothetical protein